MNLSETIVPKSDQLNADDLIAGPKTITITSVTRGSAEQPVIIHYQGDDGHPYKPGKSMRRVLVAMWGPDAKTYVGKSLTLYRDSSIRFGGDEVGGVRISHATDIARPFEIALTVTRGKRKPFTVEPLKRVSAAQLPPAQDPADLSLAEDIGRTKAEHGKDVFNAWWLGLSAELKSALKPKLAEWRPLIDAASKEGTQ